MEQPKAFIVEPVARFVNVQKRKNETGPVFHTTYAACRLDVLRGGLGLSLDNHQAKPADIKANRDHIGGECHIYSVWREGRSRERVFCRRDLVRAFPRCELQDIAK